jgi:hypothetical protein
LVQARMLVPSRAVTLNLAMPGIVPRVALRGRR